MLLNVPQETAESKKETTGNKLRRERKEYAKIRRRSFVAAALAPFRCLFYSSTLWQSGHHQLHKSNLVEAVPNRFIRGGCSLGRVCGLREAAMREADLIGD